MLLLLLAGFAFVSGKVQEHEIVYPRMIVSRSGEKQVLFRAFDEDFHLRLEPIKTISDDFVLITRDDKGGEVFLKPDVENLKKTILQDRNVGATIDVDDNGPLKIKGMINEKLRIEPNPSSHGENYEGRRGRGYGDRKKYGHLYEGFSQDTEQEREEPMEEIPHKVYKVTPRLGDTSFYDDEVFPPGVKQNSSDTTTPGTRQNQATVELAIVSDMKHSSLFKTDLDCIKYHAILVNCANLRFQTLKETNLKLTLAIVKRNHVANDQPYITNNMYDGHALSSETLYAFAKYCANDAYLRRADCVKLVTAQPLGDKVEGSDKANPGVVGIAFVGGVCDRNYKSGISEDDGYTYDGCVTFAHELGHLFGCPHDGQAAVSYIPGNPGTAQCSWDLGYIMSYISKDLNQYVFSPCCDKCISHLTTLSSGSCMFRKDVTDSITWNDYRLPGVVLSDDVWKTVTAEAFYDIKCKTMRNDWTLHKVNPYKCLKGFSCRTQPSGGYYYYYEFNCGAGDPCGPNKICKNGHCVDKW